jgi:hypothetical protein
MKPIHKEILFYLVIFMLGALCAIGIFAYAPI